MEYKTQLQRLNQRQVQNNAGGYGYEVNRYQLLDRFLILGTEVNTYYVGKMTLTKENAENIIALVKEDGLGVVNRILQMRNRAPKRSPVLFALALCVGFGDSATRKAAYQAANQDICRTGSNILEFNSYVEQLRGWGAQRRRYTANWYNYNDLNNLEYQMVKYRNRRGFTHKDLLRLSHARTNDPVRSSLYNWALGRDGEIHQDLQLVHLFETLKTATVPQIVELLRENRVTWEMLPTDALKHPLVWNALLGNMPMEAMVRNLGRMGSLGLFNSNTEARELVTQRLKSDYIVQRSGIHPFKLFLASRTYAMGRGDKGSLSWVVSTQVLEALESAFYSAFGNLKPTGKHRLVALDVSGSMAAEMITGGMTTAQDACSAMAMVIKRQDPTSDLIAFSSGYRPSTEDRAILELSIPENTTLNNFIDWVDRRAYHGGTDLGLPFVYAQRQASIGVLYDSIEVFTDSETWAGRLHPEITFDQYLDVNPRAKAIVISTVPTLNTVLENGSKVLQVVGFDAGMPELIDTFITQEGDL